MAKFKVLKKLNTPVKGSVCCKIKAGFHMRIATIAGDMIRCAGDMISKIANNNNRNKEVFR